MDEIANLEFESMSKEEIYDLYKLGRIQCETKRKLDKQMLIQILQNELRSRPILDDIDIGYEQGTKRALELIKEVLPD